MSFNGGVHPDSPDGISGSANHFPGKPKGQPAFFTIDIHFDRTSTIPLFFTSGNAALQFAMRLTQAVIDEMAAHDLARPSQVIVEPLPVPSDFQGYMPTAHEQAVNAAEHSGADIPF